MRGGNGRGVRSVGIIGHGSFGQFVHELARHHLPEAEVLVYAPSVKDGVSSLAQVAACDVVVLCVPIRAYALVLEEVVPLLGPTTLVVDVATVKEYTTTLLKRYEGLKFVATHPMFGPYSYLKKGRSLEGLRLVLTEHTLHDAELNTLRSTAQALGLVLLEMSPAEHDRMLAETLFLTHYIGQVVTKGGFKRTDIDTVSFGFLMDAVESVQNDAELFRDVYRYNTYCGGIIARFEHAEREVYNLLTKKSSAVS